MEDGFSAEGGDSEEDEALARDVMWVAEPETGVVKYSVAVTIDASLAETKIRSI